MARAPRTLLPAAARHSRARAFPTAGQAYLVAAGPREVLPGEALASKSKNEANSPKEKPWARCDFRSLRSTELELAPLHQHGLPCWFLHPNIAVLRHLLDIGLRSIKQHADLCVSIVLDRLNISRETYCR